MLAREDRAMFIGLKELRAAPGRTGVIGITVAMIAILVTFLSSLAAGLSFESVSALQARVAAPLAAPDATTSAVTDSADASTGTSTAGTGTAGTTDATGTTSTAPGAPADALVMPAGGGTSLMGSRLTPSQIDSIKQAAPSAEILYSARERNDNGEPIMLMSLPTADWNAPTGLSFDHLRVEFRPADELAGQPQTSSAALMPEDQAAALDSSEFTVLTGEDRWNVSASYTGEQLSLTLMINMLYAISALVISAFFMVWTMQRLRTVSIVFALGAPRRVILGDTLGQAAAILLGGVAVGVAVTWAAGTFASAALPVQLTTDTLLLPAVFLAGAGLVGAAVSTLPIFKVSPRDALAAE